MIEKLEYNSEGIGEGFFESKFFTDDMGNHQLAVYIYDKSWLDYAEKCIQHFNALSGEIINVICYHIIQSARQDSRNPGFELPMLEKNTDILNYCWFTSMIVSLAGDKTKASYIIQGEGDWGEVIGFVVTEDTVTYVGKNYLPNY